ncbi:MAG: hypothetical protein MMC33_005852 [Icmadophila ericetorum]|nr:hypothetical protein [Icmadophila ericetorum]
MHSPTEQEFEAFPPVVKRKYFSTLERLRLAQPPSRPASHTSASNSLTGSLGSIRIHRPNFKRSDHSTTPQSRSSPVEVSPEDAQFFLRLPAKVRRGQFSLEEQILLAGGSHQVILDAADEAVVRSGERRFQRSNSLPSLDTSPSTPSSTSECAIEDDEEDMDDAMDSFRWLDEEDDLDLTLDDYHHHVAETAVPQNKSRRPSFRRSFSLASLPFGRPSTDSKAPASATSTNFPSILNHPAHQNVVMPGARNSFRRNSVQAVDPAAQYYQDPEARLKLRVYLASPQKFDEAIEFGFPSMPTTTSSRRPSLSKYASPLTTTMTNISNTGRQTFLSDADDDDAPLYKELELISKDQSSVSTTELPSPQTPLDGDHQPFGRTISNIHPLHRLPLASNPVSPEDMPMPTKRPHVWHTISEPPYAYGWAGDREMTLKMTLTRPDLREVEEMPTGPKVADPLNWDELPPAEEGDIWTKTLKLGKLWRKMSRKN